MTIRIEFLPQPSHSRAHAHGERVGCGVEDETNADGDGAGKHPPFVGGDELVFGDCDKDGEDRYTVGKGCQLRLNKMRSGKKVEIGGRMYGEKGGITHPIAVKPDARGMGRTGSVTAIATARQALTSGAGKGQLAARLRSLMHFVCFVSHVR